MTTSLELEDFARQIDSVNASARALVDNHSLEALTRPSTTGGWSAAECLDHIVKVAEAYTPRIRAALEKGRRQGKLAAGPFHYLSQDRIKLWVLEPPVRMRVKAPAIFQPSLQPDIQTALNALLDRHAELQTLRQLADGLDLAAIRVTSPASAKLRLPVGAVFGILMAHARRHLWQARRALNES